MQPADLADLRWKEGDTVVVTVSIVATVTAVHTTTDGQHDAHAIVRPRRSLLRVPLSDDLAAAGRGTRS